jgi:hypothetical protein
LGERRFGRFAQLIDVCPTPGRSHDDLSRARLAMQMTVFARAVYVEIMMRMLDGRETETAAREFAHERDHECRFTGIFESGDAENAHGYNSDSVLFMRPQCPGPKDA